ncbi:MAG: NifU N-terminal domain-containing protein [Chloroflexi bacterium]|nr:NifU N-terminal domain-containing protein [Chloroflexota bacterium]
MSEYVTIDTRATSNPDVIEIITNMTLTDSAEEVYRSFEDGDQGSPIAQMLFNAVPGLAGLVITPNTLAVIRKPDVPWETIVDDVRDALRDFFL